MTRTVTYSLKVKSEVPQAEIAVGKIEHLLAHYDVCEDGACFWAEDGPRGSWQNIGNIDRHAWGNADATAFFNLGHDR